MEREKKARYTNREFGIGSRQQKRRLLEMGDIRGTKKGRTQRHKKEKVVCS